MIDRAVELIAARLNQHLRVLRQQADEELVVVTNVVGSDGTPSQRIDDKLALFVVNIEKDGLPKSRGGSALASSRIQRGHDTLFLNVYLMLAAGYSDGNYPNALKLLSEAMRFFQAQPVFDRRSAPELGTDLERLTLEIENLGTQELSHLWGVLGGRYLPSVCYLMRTVAIVPGGIKGESAPARALDAALGG